MYIAYLIFELDFEQSIVVFRDDFVKDELCFI